MARFRGCRAKALTPRYYLAALRTAGFRMSPLKKERRATLAIAHLVSTCLTFLERGAK
jgi:hypothetical protein